MSGKYRTTELTRKARATQTQHDKRWRKLCAVSKRQVQVAQYEERSDGQPAAQ
jgi:hypothetical protein